MLARVVIWVVCAVCAVCAGPAMAQGQGSGSSPGALTAASTGEVILDLQSFGLGEWSRPGEIAGVRIRATDQSVKPREVLIRLEGADPDGDTPLFERQVVLNPNVVQSIWLYPLLPREFDTADGMVLSAYEVAEDVGEVGGAPGELSAPKVAGRLGQLLGRSVIRMKQRIPPQDSMAAIVGTSSLSYGLADYAVTDGPNPWAASGHEVMRIVDGVRPADLPDRWMGYAGMSLVVWGSGDPLEVRAERAAALREWVQRGGHLVILMPVAGQAWTNASANELYDLLPNVTITRNEGVDMEPYRRLLTRKAQTRLPKDSVVYTFAPMATAKAGDAVRVLDGPDGKCVVARRIVGTGAVTLIGLDLNHRMIASQDLVNADVFWNRVIGKRGTIRSPAELAALPNRSAFNREEKAFETDIAREIAKGGRSATGLLLALIVFVLYWLVAGPGGFAALKKFGMIRHAWLAFFGAAGVFTAIAWGGAMILRPSRVEVAHLTILDHVYGQPVERARSWMSVLIPWYGEATLEVGEAPKTGELASRGGGDVLMPWTSPDQAQGGQDMFPDARGYGIETRAPRALTVPTRSTVKQVRADWSGGPVWKMPMPVGDAGAAGSGELKLLEEAHRAEGRLVHELPGPLTDVTIIVVRGQRPIGAMVADSMSSRAFAYSLASDDPWEPGEVLDLSAVTDIPAQSVGVAGVETTFDRMLQQGTSSAITPGAGLPKQDIGAAQRLTALGFVWQFRPPSLTEEHPLMARRTETHGWDLGVWFTEPCIIIVGHLGSVEKPLASPIPFRIDGEPVVPMGRTVVRWIYPLPEAPPAYAEAAEVSPAPSAEPGTPGGPGALRNDGAREPGASDGRLRAVAYVAFDSRVASAGAQLLAPPTKELPPCR